jgi:hypothetical protein
MAKKNSKKSDFKTTIIYLGILFSIILFFVKIVLGVVGWVSVFAPVLIAFFIVYLFSALKNKIKN